MLALVQGPDELNLYCKGCQKQHRHFAHNSVGYICERYNGYWPTAQLLMVYAYDDKVVPWELILPDHVRRVD